MLIFRDVTLAVWLL